jgi:alpha-tubulin suppressor-like RCC1 family protein
MDVPCWHLTSLPYVLVAMVVRWLPCPSDVASLDCAARLFHMGDPISAIEEGLRLRAKAAFRQVRAVLPSGEISWTQWLLWVERILLANGPPVVAGSNFHVAFVDVEGHLLTCGASTDLGPGSSGVLGQGIDVEVSTVPRQVAGLDGVHIRTVAVGSSHTLAVCNLGVVYTFGRGHFGQLGYNVTSPHTSPDSWATHHQFTPRPIDSLLDVHILAVAAAHNHSLAVSTTGQLYTFGMGHCGQLGHGTGPRNERFYTPRIVAALHGVIVTAVSAGGRHSLVLSSEGGVYSFGSDMRGQLGQGDPSLIPDDHVMGNGHTVAQYYPRQIQSLVGVEICGVSAGEEHSLTVSCTGSLYTFGAGSKGQLGHGDDLRDHFSPMLVTALQGIRILGTAAGEEHSLVTGEHNVIYSFGASNHGQLGHGDVEPRVVPTAIKHLQGMYIHSLCAGSRMSVAATVYGEAYGWGVGVQYAAPGDFAAAGQPWGVGVEHEVPIPIPIPLLGLELTANQLVPLRYPTIHLHA